ncbi:rare lipoprotein A (peptidoglycan hydrolase) [Bradyrhizobium sp. GM2.4]
MRRVRNRRSATRRPISAPTARPLSNDRTGWRPLHPRPISRARIPDGDAKQSVSHGVASFYSDTETASGERFDKNELTAAHPSLPFGTKLRVTDVSSGRFVTVRINDRGPYVRGRVVDVSPSAAEALGMVDKGVTNVRLDVVQ